MDKAIKYLTQAVLIISDRHIDKLGWLNNLGNS